MLGSRGLAIVLGAAMLLATGCSERLLRENVFANTETGIGIFVTQNSKTQFYEGKLGYFRHELFLVPTYKVVDGDSEDATVVGPLDQTPEVLADIEGSAGFGLGNNQRTGIRQRLAVGRRAVEAPAAVALMADDASIAEAITNSMVGSRLRPEDLRLAYDLIGNVYRELDRRAGKTDDPDPIAKAHVDRLNKAAVELLTPERWGFKHYDLNDTITPAMLTLNTEGSAPSGDPKFSAVIAQLEKMRKSKASLENTFDALGQNNAVNYKNLWAVDTSVVNSDNVPSPAATTQDAAAFAVDYASIRDEFNAFDTQLRSNQDVVAAVNYYISLLQGSR